MRVLSSPLMACLLAFWCHCSCTAADLPNVIVVLADDLGYSDLGCYGGEIPTPNIDALAKGGVRFSQMYNSARCCPTRASLMTGLYPSQAGIGDFTSQKPDVNKGPGYLGRLRDDCSTMAEMLKPNSYRSYYVGKWHMHSQTGPIDRGFDEFYGYTNDHSHDQYDRDYYERLPANRSVELEYPKDKYYATDAFNDYALEFIRQGQKSGSPWLLFLAHSSPHFPVQAPADRADKFEQVYLKGWDKLREERFERMKKIGLASGPAWKLSPRSIVPVDKSEIANGYSGELNPSWDSLPEDRQRDLARRMAVYAAMVESVDQGVGRIVQHLKDTKDFENTLILFTSDNGACYEWGPFGFDGVSRKGETTLYTKDRLREIGGPGTHHAYGSAWANLCNTPLRLYKHFTHEGGITSPLIAHWPKGLEPRADFNHAPVHVMDIVPTVLAATNAKPPMKRGDVALQSLEGKNLLPTMRGEKLPERGIGFDHQGAHAWRKGDWKIVWSKRMPTEIRWELYNIAEDRCEMNDLASKHPDRVERMVAEWNEWARRVGVIWEPQKKAAVEVKQAPSAKIVQQTKSEKPNVIFILSDDLAQGDVGAYGQRLIQTPNLDRMSREGTRFLQAYCGTTVCAPSRASLMTGLHTGHSPIRANREIQPEGQKPLPAETFTVPQLLKSQGYATAAIGKWGMGMFDTTGSPLKKGVDHFFGYNCQRHAHSYFPTYLYDDDKRIELIGNDGNKNVAGSGAVYAQDRIADESLKWVREHKDSPFFLFYAITLPHGTFQIDSQGIYADKPWTEVQKNYAAMVTRLDSDVGRLMNLLVELKIDKNTLIVFSGDNGSSFAPDSEMGKLFDQTMGGKLRGFKRSLYEGGLRQAAMAWWPGTVPAGRVTEEPWAFWDFLPTIAELAETKLPENVKTDGYSLVSFLKGGEAPKRDHFYWELHEGASLQAARWSNWKAVRNGPSKPIEIYDLANDVSESKDLAVTKPDLVAKAELLFKTARDDHPDWPLVDRRANKK